MVHSASQSEESLAEFLASRARRASRTRLITETIVASLAAVAIGVWRGPAWEIRLSLAICLFAFCMWGVTDREVARWDGVPGQELIGVKAIRLAAAAIGFAAAAFLMMALLGRALGRIIS
jgi:hypothetical protein